MLFRQLLLPGLVLPAVAALVALGLVATVDGRRRRTTVGGASLAVGAAFVATYVAIGGWPAWPPIESTQRLFYVVALAALAGLVWGWWRESGAPWVPRGVLLAMLLVLVLRAPLENTWNAGQAASWLGGLFAVGLVMGWSVDSSLGGAAGWRPALVRLALLAGTAALLGMSGSLRLAQLLGGVTCGAAVVEALAPRWGRRPWVRADSMVLTTVVLGLLLAGYFFAALEPWAAALAAAAWLLLGPATHGRRWRAALALLPLAAALALAGYAVLSEETDPYGDYGALTTPAVEGNITAPAA
jgi:MFS family permease